MAPNVCVPQVCNLFHVTILMPRFFRWLLHSRNICAQLY